MNLGALACGIRWLSLKFVCWVECFCWVGLTLVADSRGFFGPVVVFVIDLLSIIFRECFGL